MVATPDVPLSTLLLVAEAAATTQQGEPLLPYSLLALAR
jgi:hypothetical protein